MGKSRVRFKQPDTIPPNLIAELARKIDLEAWIKQYEAAWIGV